jgi:hypothetical protein
MSPSSLATQPSNNAGALRDDYWRHHDRMRLDHITLPASDVERSASLYVVLGLTQIVANYPHYARLMELFTVI